jgi:type IV pilus assembly protein PilW
MMVYPLSNKNDGFMLIELLISMAIFSVIIGAIFSFSIAQRKYFSVQEQISEMIQNARAAMDMIAGELAVAGYNPTGAVGLTGIPYNASQLRIYADTVTPSDGKTIGSNEDIVYSYDSGNKRIVRNTGSGDQPLAENVQNFSFDYFDDQGDPTTDTPKIRQIRLTMTVRTSKPDPQYPANSGYRTYTLISLVTPRNLAYR